MAENLIAVFGQDQQTAAPWARLVGSENGVLVEEAFSQVNEANFESLFTSPMDPSLGEHPDGGLVVVAIVGANGSKKLQSRRMYFVDGVFTVDEAIEVSIPNYTSIDLMKDYVYLHVLNDNTNANGQGYQVRDLRTLELVASGNHIVLDQGGFTTSYNHPGCLVRNTLYFRSLRTVDAYEWIHGVRFDYDAGGARSDFTVPGYSTLAAPNTSYTTVAQSWTGVMATRNGSTSIKMAQSAPWQVHSASSGSNHHTYERRHGALDEYGTLVILQAGFQPSPAFDAKPSKGAIQPYPNALRQVSFTPHDEATVGDQVVCSWQNTRQASTSHPQPYSWHAFAGEFTMPPIGVGGLITLPFTHSVIDLADQIGYPGDGWEWPMFTGGTQNLGVSSGELMVHIQDNFNDASTHALIASSTVPTDWELLAWSWEWHPTEPQAARYTPIAVPVIEYVDDGVRRNFAR